MTGDLPIASCGWRTGIQLGADTDLAVGNPDSYNRHHSKGEQYNQWQYEQFKTTLKMNGWVKGKAEQGRDSVGIHFKRKPR